MVPGFTFFHFTTPLKRHLETHSIAFQEPFECDICGKLIRHKKSLLTYHMKTHCVEKPVKCSICGKEFTTNSSLKRHLPIHSDRRDFKCKICGRDFRLKTSFESHLRSHANKREFVCQICGKTFNRKLRVLWIDNLLILPPKPSITNTRPSFEISLLLIVKANFSIPLDKFM